MQTDGRFPAAADRQGVRPCERRDRDVKYLLALIMIGALVWYGYGNYKPSSAPVTGGERTAPTRASVASDFTEAKPTSAQLSCDGRTHCSQMRSCAEATYFIQHCPNTKMDGDNDGVPCESQWCN